MDEKADGNSPADPDLQQNLNINMIGSIYDHVENKASKNNTFEYQGLTSRPKNLS